LLKFNTDSQLGGNPEKKHENGLSSYFNVDFVDIDLFKIPRCKQSEKSCG
jgi:hypothetical protein